MKYIKIKNKEYIYKYVVDGVTKYAVRKRIRGVKKIFFKSSLSSIEEAEKVVSSLLIGINPKRYRFYEVCDLFKKYLNDDSKSSVTTIYTKSLKVDSLKKYFDNVYYDILNYESYISWFKTLNKRNLIPSTKNAYISLFKELDEFALRQLKIKSNLSDCFEKVSSVPQFDDFHSVVKTEHFLTRDEVQKIIDNSDEYYSLLFSCMFFMALRIGELRGLKPKYFDFEKGIGYVVGNVQTKTGKGISYDIGHTKGKKVVSRKLPKHLVEDLKSFILKNKLKDDDFIFFGKKHNIPIGETTISRYLKNVCAKLNIQGAHTHSFRKAFCNYLSLCGLSDDEIARYVGHSNVSITRASYLSLNDMIIDKIMSKIDD